MIVSLIAAIAKNGAIGKDNKLLWRLSADMKIFKSLTTGHHIIMGRKTFESMGSKPLPNRTNIVISRNLDFEPEGCMGASSLAEAFQIASDQADEEAFVIGGGEIYRLAIHKADVLYITHVHADIEGDTYFPSIDQEIWEVAEKQSFKKDEKNEYDFDFCVYQRKTKT